MPIVSDNKEERGSTFATSRNWQSIAATATSSYKVHSTSIPKEKGYSTASIKEWIDD